MEPPPVGQNKDPLCLFYFNNPGDEGKRQGEISKHYAPLTKWSKPTRTERNILRLGARNIVSSSGDTDLMEKTRRTCRPKKRKDGFREHKKKGRGYGRDTPHHLKSYLFSSVKPSQVLAADQLPPLTEVLTTLQDAWPAQNLDLERCEKHSSLRRRKERNESDVMSQSIVLPDVPVKLARRRSVPEEIIRKFSVSKEHTSESETNATMPEPASSSSKEPEEPTERISSQRRERPVTKSDRMRASFFAQQVDEKSIEKEDWIKRSFQIMEEPERSAEEGSSDSDSDAPGIQRLNTVKRAPLRRGSVLENSTNMDHSAGITNQQSNAVRVSQKDYNISGHGILKPRVSEKYSQTGECTCRSARNDSETTPSAQEESESAESSESISSPTLCTRPLTSSENQSSDSEGIPCTCAELTSSKDTSTDPYLSGKSTLSQTVSEKSVSTQDSTVSINSVSTGGSSISAASGTSSPDIDPKTSAKETTSPDHTPRTPRRGGRGGRSNGRNNERGHPDVGYNSHNRRQGGGHDRTCPRYQQNKAYRGGRNYSTNIKLQNNDSMPCPTKEITQNDLNSEEFKQMKQRMCQVDQGSQTLHDSQQTQENNTFSQVSRTYEWAARTAEETNVRQQQLRDKFIDNNREFTAPIPGNPLVATGTVSLCSGTGSSYHPTKNIEGLPLMVPRYSALPRSLSMVVNTSSIEISHNSDSESIADSLEGDQNEQPSILFDTKNEMKPVRGDVTQALSEKSRNWKYKLPRGKAYFVSIEGEEGEIVTDIYKIPEPPDKIKSNIFERHALICKNRQSREKMHEISNLPSARPTFTKRIRRERKLKLKEQEVQKERKTSKKEKTLGNKTKESKKEIHVDSANKKGKIGKENSPKQVHASNTSISENNSSRQEKRNVSKIPILVRSTSTSPDRSLEIDGLADRKVSITEKREEPPTKPQAVIHPSPMLSPMSQQLDMETLKRHRLSLISSLESTATILKAQQQGASTQKQWHKNQPIGTKRSANPKFQQKFEVIPEERSSSLSSSADDRLSELAEKDRRRSLPVKLTEDSHHSNLLAPGIGGKSFRRYSLGSLSNYIISKLMGRPLQAIPCVQRGPNNENQQIIIFSPKDSSATNSAKGRDALIAVNRQDFNRLSKGWMNFYLLKEETEEDSALGEELTQEINTMDENDTGDNLLQPEENKLFPGDNTIVCRIPSMEKDTTTSGSGTDETNTSPTNHPEFTNLDFENFKKRYSLLLRDAETDCFELKEYTETSTKEVSNEDTDSNNKFTETSSGTNEHSILVASSTDHENDAVDDHILSNLQNEMAKSINQNNSELVNVPYKNKPSFSEDTTNKKSTKEVGTSTQGKIIRRCATDIKSNLKLSDDIRFNSSNTVLRTTKLISASPKRDGRRSCRSNRGVSLPELPQQSRKGWKPQKASSVVEALPRVSGTSSEDMDSDSTVYMMAPSPQIPPLPLDGICDCLSDSFSSSDDEMMNVPKRQPQHATNPQRIRTKSSLHDLKPSYKSGKSGWSVTVAGPVVFPDSTPDVQMRLSFPAAGGPPQVSQSDSGFVDERIVGSRAASHRKQEWTVTVKNPRTGKSKEKSMTVLPTLNNRGTERNTKRVPKAKADELEIDTIVSKIPHIWSKVQAVIEDELKQWRSLENQDQHEEPNLLISGRAMPFDLKPKPTKMSDRDVTRNTTARNNSVQRSSQTQD